MHFSAASHHPCFRQHKRQLNHKLSGFLCSLGSQRRAAKELHLSRTTVARKLVFLGQQALLELADMNQRLPQVNTMEFDDLETFEHTKCKPLSVTMAVEFKTRRILDFEVSSMPAKGLLVRKALKKYGPRKDERAFRRKALFARLRPMIHPQALIKSDESPHYPVDVKVYFPLAVHERHPGRRSSSTGQGELKKGGFDPLFCLNQTYGMLRANINRLIRKTWCTTKLQEKLRLHLAMYAVYHNKKLLDLS